MEEKIEENSLKLKHPSGDGTYVPFSKMTNRQMDVLKHYEKLTGKYDIKKTKTTVRKSRIG